MPSKIRSIIVDDEPSSILALQDVLNEYIPQVVVEGKATDPIEAAEIIQKIKPDLVFLDIEMPHANAFELLDSLAPVKFEVIFVTAYTNHAARAFRYTAVDYLLKPINSNELLEAIAKIMKRMQDRKALNSKVSAMLNNLSDSGTGPTKLSLPTSEGFRIEDVRNIAYMHAEGSYTAIIFKDKSKELVSKNLKEFEDLLPEHQFCRVHHSHIVNIECVKQYYKGRGGYVEMTDGKSIEISVRKRADFFAKFMR
jgi:two-component system, LytTR family, response regulator